MEPVPETTTRTMEELRGKAHSRTFNLQRDTVNEEDRTVELAFSSEEAFPRYWGIEILGHEKGECQLDRLNNAAPVLKDHDRYTQTGVIESARIDKDKKGRAVVRFSKNAKGEEEFQDVKDGIRTKVSVGYYIDELVLIKKGKDEPDTYRVTNWTPYEISLVSVPADDSVGVGRSETGGEVVNPVSTVKTQESEKHMEPKVETREAAETPTVDIKVIQEQTRRAEQDRITEIRSMANHFNEGEFADSFINNGNTVEEFHKALLDKLGKPNAIRTAESPEIGMDQKDISRFSVLKALNAMVNAREGKRDAWKDAGLELEASRAAAQRIGRDPQGIFLPFDILSRDMTVGTPTGGGNLVATNLLASSFIEMLRNKMVLSSLGSQTLSGLNGNIAIPRQTGGATAYWVAEGNAPTESTQAVDQVPMSPKTVGAFTDITRKLLLQSSIDVEAFVRNDLATTLAIALDYAGINGSGNSNQPRGVINTSGIGSVVGGTHGAAPNDDDIIDLETEVAIDNADIGNLAYLTNAKIRGKLKKTRIESGHPEKVWDRHSPETPLNGYKTGVTNQVPSNLDKGDSVGVCSAILFGNWSDLIFGLWGALDITLDPYTQSTTGTVRVVTLQDADVCVRHAQSFAAMLDALTA